MSTADLEESTGLEGFDVRDPKIQACPYPFYRVMRSQCPVFQHPRTKAFYVSKYEDIRFIKRHPEIFSSEVPYDDRAPNSPMAIRNQILKEKAWESMRVLQSSDPPRHNRWRQYIDRTFTASRVNSMKPYVDQTVNDLIDEWIDDGECDFVSQFAVPLPIKIIADQLGFPREDWKQLKIWSDAMLDIISNMLDEEEMIRCAHLEVEAEHFFKKIIDERRETPTDDIVSSLVNTRIEGEEPLSIPELMEIMRQLLNGGNETTTSSLSHAMWSLLRYPEEMQKLRADRSLIRNFVEESLRFETPVQGLFRKTVQDTELSGTFIPKGSIVFLVYGSANRDEDKFEEGEEFNISRRNAGAHISFGMGAHFCPGAMLARREMTSAFDILLDRLDDIELARPLQEETHHPHLFLHQLKELPIKFQKIK